jgi:MFS family permease
MYSDDDLDAAVKAGILQPSDVAALRDFVSAERSSPAVDEEHFRLISGFNDIFVSIASVLVLVAVAWLGGRVGAAVSAGLVAAVAWGLAEFFTRERRMALPSILLLLAFVGGVFGCAAALLFAGPTGFDRSYDWSGADETASGALRIALAALIAAGAAWAHWRRFRVPITIAAGTGAAVAVATSLLFALVPTSESVVRITLFVAGILVFALAMRWDMSDPERQTRRADVAFWLHLLAAPLIVHPVFSTFDRGGSPSEALLVIALYVVLGLIALAVDRRALMVSALAYVLFAFGRLFHDAGSLSPAITALLIGSALLLLSAFWHSARGAVLAKLPVTLRRRLPPLGHVVSRRPAS